MDCFVDFLIHLVLLDGEELRGGKGIREVATEAIGL
jgi:hypothetical protein